MSSINSELIGLFSSLALFFNPSIIRSMFLKNKIFKIRLKGFKKYYFENLSI